MKESMIKKAAALMAAALMVFSLSATSFAEPTSRPRPGTSSSTSSSSSSSSDRDSDENTDSSSDEDEDSSGSSSDKDTDSSSKSSSSDKDTDSSSKSSSSDKDTDSSSKSSTSDKDTDSSSKDSAKEEESTKAKATKMPVVTEAPAAEAPNKSYTTKGGAFLWFLLSVIVNTIISFAIANRFYKLTKRSNHVQSELRALRRDLEEKFSNSVGGFVESNVDITNTNDDYSMDEDGIKMTPASTVSVDDEPGDIYKQWEEQFGARYAARKAEKEEIEEEEYNEEPRVRRYQPTRESSREMSVSERLAARRARREEGIEEEDFDEKDSIGDKLSSVGDKAKKLLGGIFPFDEDDDEE